MFTDLVHVTLNPGKVPKDFQNSVIFKMSCDHRVNDEVSKICLIVSIACVQSCTHFVETVAKRVDYGRLYT